MSLHLPQSMSDYVYVVALLPLIAIGLTHLQKNNAKRYPPGPPADPILGHARIFPLVDQYKTFADWGKKFGDVVYAHVLGKPFIILESLEATRELLDRRGVNYSDRPAAVLYRIMGWSRSIFNLPYGDRWKQLRKLISQHFTPSSVKEFYPLIESEVLAFLGRFDGNPDCFKHNAQMLFSSAALNVTYGHQVVSDDDRYVMLIEESGKLLTKYSNPGGMLVDFVPILRFLPAWFPGAAFIRHAKVTKAFIEKMCDELWDIVVQQKVAGDVPPSLVAKWQEEYEESQTKDVQYEEDLKLTGFCTYLAAVETSESVLLTFFIMMILNPHVAKRAQAEIDKLVDEERRLPTFEDRKRLPYVDCIIKETFRMNATVPLGLPHASVEDDVYNGMFIPAGSIVLQNIWKMFNDENIYENSNKFKPERFMDKVMSQAKREYVDSDSEDDNSRGKSGATREGGIQDPSEMVFGFGRRICPGRHFADAELYLTISNLLAVYNILPALDPKTGKEVLPNVEFTSGVTIQPKPFDCRVVPRSDKSLALLRD